MSFEPSRTPEQYRVPARTYYHQHNYAKFHFDLGVAGSCKTVEFANYRYITDDKREQDQLQFVADIPGTFIYTLPDNEIATQMERERQQEFNRAVHQTAAAAAADSNRQFDPNAPIVPVNSATPHGMAVVGVQHSLSGSVASNPMTVKPVVQSAAPSAVDAARENLMKTVAAAKTVS